MAKKVDPDELIDSKQVADQLGLSDAGGTRVYRSRYEDFPAPVVDRGRCVLWDRGDIERWRQSREKKS